MWHRNRICLCFSDSHARLQWELFHSEIERHTQVENVAVIGKWIGKMWFCVYATTLKSATTWHTKIDFCRFIFMREEAIVVCRVIHVCRMTELLKKKRIEEKIERRTEYIRQWISPRNVRERLLERAMALIRFDVTSVIRNICVLLLLVFFFLWFILFALISIRTLEQHPIVFQFLIRRCAHT